MSLSFSLRILSHGKRSRKWPNVIKLILPEGTPGKKKREEVGNSLLLFPVSGSRIPKISDFCEKRNENPQTRFAQTEWIFVSTQNSEI